MTTCGSSHPIDPDIISTLEMIEVMKAYAAGRVIQVYNGSEYADTARPSWDWDGRSDVYRVKPETTFTPLTPEQAARHIGKEVKRKHGPDIPGGAIILSVRRLTVEIAETRRARRHHPTYEELAKDWVLEDGTILQGT